MHPKRFCLDEEKCCYRSKIKLRQWHYTMPKERVRVNQKLQIKGEKAGLRYSSTPPSFTYSDCTPLYSACTPLVLHCTPLVLHSYSAVLRCILLCSAILRCTPLVLHCTPLVLRLYPTRTPEYWSLAFSPLLQIQ